jgi:hypothetical protein
MIAMINGSTRASERANQLGRVERTIGKESAKMPELASRHASTVKSERTKYHERAMDPE